MKKIILSLSLLLILISLISNINSNLVSEDGKELLTFYEENGLNDTNELTKDQFIELVAFIMGKTIDPTNVFKSQLRLIVARHSGHVSSTFNKDEVAKYITQDFLLKISNDFIDFRFPGKQGEEMKEELNKMKEQKKNEEL